MRIISILLLFTSSLFAQTTIPANRVNAGPTSGSPAPAKYRLLVPGDLPLSSNIEWSGDHTFTGVFHVDGVTPVVITGSQVDFNAGGSFNVYTGDEFLRLSIDNNGGWTINGTTGTSGQVITSGGSGATPTWSTLFTPAALSRTNDTNVTLTLGGTPGTALLQATSLTLGWTGTLAYSRFVDGAGLSVVGRASNTSGAQADIAAGSDYNILRRSGTSIGFGSIDLSQSGAVGSSILPIANGGTGAATFPGWLAASGVTLTGTNIITMGSHPVTFTGNKTTFTGTSTTAGLNVGVLSANPSGLATADVWYVDTGTTTTSSPRIRQRDGSTYHINSTTNTGNGNQLAFFLNGGGPGTLTSSANGTFNGTTFTLTANMSVNGTWVVTGVISPTQITSNQNDYNPSGLSSAYTLRLSTDASRNITSIAGGASGRRLLIFNIGSQNIVLTADDGSTGTAANRFVTEYTILPGKYTEIIYDGTTQRWRNL